MSSYCDFAPNVPFHDDYHDKEYGFPLSDDDRLFERLCLEIMQAGLSWDIVLKKRAGMVEAFDGFNLVKVAAYGEEDFERLRADARIIRNRLKISSIIDNANTILRLKEEFGSFSGWLDHHHPLTLKEWTKLFKKTFRFTGGEIVNEFLMSTGYLPGAHREDCPVFKEIARLNPAWMRKQA